MVLIANGVQIAVYAIGAAILYTVGVIWLLIYLLYIGVLEFRLLKRSCVNCYYYGAYCAFGKGKLCSFLFEKGDPKKFAADTIAWKDIIPDFMVSVIPIVVGGILLLRDFNWMVLIFVVSLFLLTFVGNAAVRGSWACAHCTQREIGCPAEQLFSGKRE